MIQPIGSKEVSMLRAAGYSIQEIDRFGRMMLTLHQSDPCTALRCTYYTHYLLRYNPLHHGARLDHVPYHEAERKCVEAQANHQTFSARHPDPALRSEHQRDIETFLRKQCEYWERRICT